MVLVHLVQIGSAIGLLPDGSRKSMNMRSPASVSSSRKLDLGGAPQLRVSLNRRAILQILPLISRFGARSMKSVAFMTGQIKVPADFDSMGADEIADIKRAGAG